LPPTVINDCGLDYDRWYPKHRRVIGAVSSVRHFRADLPHFRAALDRVGETCGVRCAPVRV
jgi:hypothetical protein